MKPTYFLLLLGIYTTFTAFSCKKEKTPDRDKFLATYAVVEPCSSGNYTYSSSITTSSTSESEVLISNFGDFGESVRGTVSGSNLTIATQTLNSGGTAVTINGGSGAINGNILTINYAYSVATDSENCSMNCTKQ